MSLHRGCVLVPCSSLPLSISLFGIRWPTFHHSPVHPWCPPPSLLIGLSPPESQVQVEPPAGRHDTPSTQYYVTLTTSPDSFKELFRSTSTSSQWTKLSPECFGEVCPSLCVRESSAPASRCPAWRCTDRSNRLGPLPSCPALPCPAIKAGAWQEQTTHELPVTKVSGLTA